MAFPPARNPRSGKQYKHKTRKKEEKKNQNYFTDTLSIYSEKQSFPLLWKWFNKKPDTPFWLYKVYICTKGKVKWTGSVILRHSRPHSFSFLICALSSSVKSSARLSSALICSDVFPMIRLATTCTISAITMQCNVDWRLRKIRDIFSIPRIMAKLQFTGTDNWYFNQKLI